MNQAGQGSGERAFELSDEDIDAYQRDGAVCLRGVLSQDELRILREGVDENLAHPSPRAIVASKPDDPGWFIEDFSNWQENASYRKLIFESRLAEIAGRLMRSSTSRFYHDHMLTKEPGTRQRTPWHQDQPYYNIEGDQNCSMWIPVDPVSRESTLELVAGTHRGPWLMPRSFMERQAKWFPAGSLAELPDIDAHPENHRVLGWAVQPGDIVCFHMLMLHAASGVPGAGRRRVLSLRFIGDDIRHAPREWKTSPEFPGLRERLPAGVPMEDPLFPVLWKA